MLITLVIKQSVKASLQIKVVIKINSFRVTDASVGFTTRTIDAYKNGSVTRLKTE